MKIIQTKLKDMPSSFLAELGSYRYNVFVKSEGWAIPSRLSSPGQEYDRYDCSDVICLIAWTAQYGICGYARLMAGRLSGSSGLEAGGTPSTGEQDIFWEMSRFSARMEIDAELPLNILWHATQLAEQSGIHYLYSAATPMLEKMFDQHQISYQSLMPGVVQSEDNLFSIKIPVNQPCLAAKFRGSRRFTPEEVLPTFGVSANFGLRGRHNN
ncbi:autoinducer synthase [Erwinia pyrifoliae]|uniref:Acyl-homoserine-lactone synthase n=1 Tax=Erwinia pyrifoliae TaxID=79967 RepID=A0ABY5XDE0_ERWPY|nr:autoinducer synthase [Erwinia pyrifoliae]AUX72335.1 autoinducer synthase [Erwinia pyrifoliae]MCA8877421.1 autoinducer synthase [Erwinia pyrifoliae]MCT2388587.1 autoinducer synthase [Erwinia pyrifoliae]MCU8586756.1 autoinducer synthase [Erwinia pyrifoliae]UWS31739.1 autoinducer synthase [Erwinia pyrifoliae]